MFLYVYFEQLPGKTAKLSIFFLFEPENNAYIQYIPYIQLQTFVYKLLDDGVQNSHTTHTETYI